MNLTGTTDQLSAQFHEIVKAAMEEQGVSARQLASRVRTSHQTVTEILRKQASVRPSTIVEWLDALGFTVTLQVKDKRKRNNRKE